jgi:hypothetical protein
LLARLVPVLHREKAIAGDRTGSADIDEHGTNARHGRRKLSSLMEQELTDVRRRGMLRNGYCYYIGKKP